MARLKDYNWNMSGTDQGRYDVNAIVVNLLMDIRDELKLMNARLQCHETAAIPRYLRRIAANTTKKRRKK